MAPTPEQRYDQVPPIPSYDEAVAGGSAWHADESAHHHTTDAEAEGQSLLTGSRHAFESPSPSPGPHPPRGRPPRGYRPPTVETDDETDLFSSDDDSDSTADEREADHVRREMQEMEIDDSGTARGSSWGKRIGLSLTLPRWKWRWRLPTLRRRTQDDGGGGGGAGGGGGDSSATAGAEGEQTSEPFLFRPPSLPKFGSAALFLLVGRTMAALLVMGFLYLLFASDLFAGVARRMGSQMFDPESVRMHVQSNVDPRRIREHLKHFTSYPHLAGTEGDFALMEDTELLFSKYGLEDITRDVYQVYLNYPRAGGRAVEILGDDGKPVWSAKLEEEDVGGRAAGHQTYVFHPHSKSGDVSGPLVYVNHGMPEDLQFLKDKGIETKGAIALMTYLGPGGYIDEMLLWAEQAGFVGCLVFVDYLDAHPKFMPDDGVERGSASRKYQVIGDVLTPGWGSKDNMPRMKVDQTKGLPKIPSLPLSRRDSQVLFQHIRGFGESAPGTWLGWDVDPDSAHRWTGNASSPIVRLRNEQDEVEKQPIWNVYGRINGIEQSEKKVIIGNHRDSIASGATNPHSGTAVMLEIVRLLGDLVSRGWRPLRTIEFASWDGGEYNMIGSTEYVEQHEDALRKDALAYINLDQAVTGSSFEAYGSPVFRQLLLQVLNRVSDPHYNATLRELWRRSHGHIGPAPSGSDSAAFSSIVGTATLDLRFRDHTNRYPTHSSYDTFEWMDKTGDPGFVYHTLMGQVLGLLVLELADRPVLPFDMPAYADEFEGWIDELEKWAAEQAKPGKPPALDSLRKAAADTGNSIATFFKWAEKWENLVLAAGGWEPSSLGAKRCEFNTRMGTFESDLIDPLGIPDRKQFKHVLFGPPPPGHMLGTSRHFPSIVDAVVSGNETRAQLAVDNVAAILKAAGKNLEVGGRH